MLKPVLKIFFLLILVSPLLLVVMLLASLQQQSLITEIPVLKHNDVKKIRAILKRHDPRKAPAGTKKRLELDEQSLNLLGTYGLQTLTTQLSAAGMQSYLHDNNIKLQLSVRLPRNPVGSYFNLQFSLRKLNQQLDMHSMSIGPWAVPDILSSFIPELAGYLLSRNDYWTLAQEALLDYRFTRQALEIDYHWKPEWEKQARAKIRELTDHDAMNHYAKILYELPYLQRSSFAVVISNLFKQAGIRSDKHDSIKENIAVLQLLGQWALGKQTYDQWYLPSFNVRLRGRVDLAQHILVSAAIASQSNTELSNLIGTGKEISDSAGGSGFSFSDLAADRAGSLLGKLATKNPATARTVQLLLSDNYHSKNLLPDTSQLPAPLTEQQFLRQFGSIKDPRYKKLVKDIDSMIMSLSFFQQLEQLHAKQP